MLFWLGPILMVLLFAMLRWIDAPYRKHQRCLDNIMRLEYELQKEFGLFSDYENEATFLASSHSEYPERVLRPRYDTLSV